MSSAEKIITLQLSSDAFFYLKTGEPPIDEDNLEEALEIIGDYPNGFTICDDYEAIEGTDMVEAIFIIKPPQNVDYDAYHMLTNYEDIRIKWLDTNTVRHYIVGVKGKPTEGKIRGEGIYAVHINKYGDKYYETGDIKGHPPTGIRVFLKHFKKR